MEPASRKPRTPAFWLLLSSQSLGECQERCGVPTRDQHLAELRHFGLQPVGSRAPGSGNWNQRTEPAFGSQKKQPFHGVNRTVKGASAIDDSQRNPGKGRPVEGAA